MLQRQIGNFFSTKRKRFQQQKIGPDPNFSAFIPRGSEFENFLPWLFPDDSKYLHALCSGSSPSSFSISTSTFFLSKYLKQRKQTTDQFTADLKKKTKNKNKNKNGEGSFQALFFGWPSHKMYQVYLSMLSAPFWQTWCSTLPEFGILLEQTSILCLRT